MTQQPTVLSLSPLAVPFTRATQLTLVAPSTRARQPQLTFVAPTPVPSQPLPTQPKPTLTPLPLGLSRVVLTPTPTLTL